MSNNPPWIAIVVEDTYDDVQLIAKILTHFGITVHAARNGTEGLELLKSVDPTFIVTDLAMPLKDGWEMLQAIRANVATAHIPVIAVTAYDSAAVADAAFNAGFNGYFPKPVDPMTFVQNVRAIVAP